MKVLLIGVDALDSSLLDRFASNLPSIRALRESGTTLPVRSTFPPDSDTAWATISTGLNPAEHGVVRFVDPLEKSYQILNVGSPNDALRGRTFWELAGEAGRRVVAIFPHLCYPVWAVPGVMVARGSATAGAASNRPEVLSLYPRPDLLAGVRGFPAPGERGLLAHAERLTALALADAEFAVRLLEREPWDLGFVYFSTLDAVAHFFWGHFDSTSPGYAPGNRLERVIPDAYRLYDEIVGRLACLAGPDTTVILMSDHGHGGRPTRLVGVNEILRRGGLLVTRDPRRHPEVALVEGAKRAAVGAVGRLGLARAAGAVLRRAPSAMGVFTRPPSIDWSRTAAYATDMSGVKAYPYGGVRINREVVGKCYGESYEGVRDRVVGLLADNCRLPDGRSLLKLVGRREDLHSGPHVARYPDVVLELEHGYGVGWAVGGPTITPATSYDLVPGCHRGETGAFVIRSPRRVSRDVADLLDVTPTILDLLGVAPRHAYSGASLLGRGAP